MDCLRPGQHGSTYGGNPLGCKVAIAALEVLRDEKLSENAHTLGFIFREEMRKMKAKHAFIKAVRGEGLLNAVEVDPQFAETVTAWQICMEMARQGLLAKPTHDNIIRFAPPLVINETQLKEACAVISGVFASFDKSKEEEVAAEPVVPKEAAGA